MVFLITNIIIFHKVLWVYVLLFTSVVIWSLFIYLTLVYSRVSSMVSYLVVLTSSMQMSALEIWAIVLCLKVPTIVSNRFPNKIETIDVRQGRLSIHTLNDCQNNRHISIGLVLYSFLFFSSLSLDYSIRVWTRNNLSFAKKKFFYILSVIDSSCVSGEPKIFKYHCLNIRKIEPNIRV